MYVYLAGTREPAQWFLYLDYFTYTHTRTYIYKCMYTRTYT